MTQIKVIKLLRIVIAHESRKFLKKISFWHRKTEEKKSKLDKATQQAEQNQTFL
jgi:hypothetical protein